MAQPMFSPHPEPERFRVRLQTVGDVKKKAKGWQFRALAQIYNVPNDRLMLFRFGSGTKTIAERVPRGRVAVLRGHPFVQDDRTTVGKVVSAEESQNDGGLVYDAVLSSTEEELAQKMIEGIVDENSIELFVLREAIAEVPHDDIPAHVRRFVRTSTNGLAEVREILEYMWMAVGLLTGSSQDMESILEAPRLVPFADLPVADRNCSWDPAAARERVLAWAGDGGSTATPARLSRAFLCRSDHVTGVGADAFAFQIADVVDDRLVVVPAAVELAAARLSEHLADDPQTLVAAAVTLGRYRERLTNPHPAFDNRDELTTSSSPETASSGTPAEGSGQGETPPDSVASADSPPTETGSSEESGTSREEALAQIAALREELESVGRER